MIKKKKKNRNDLKRKTFVEDLARDDGIFFNPVLKDTFHIIPVPFDED